MAKKKIISSEFSNSRNLVFDQSSPVQPVSEYRGGDLSVTKKKKKKKSEEVRKSLCLILDDGYVIHNTTEVQDLPWLGFC